MIPLAIYFRSRRAGIWVLCTSVFCTSAFAQSGGAYAIKKGTINAGGGTVTGSGHLLSGTVGQHDAAVISGGAFRLTGGFWEPDVNSLPPVFTLMPDPSGLDKSRFISFRLPTAFPPSALRVKLDSLHHVFPPYTGGASTPFTSFEGQVRWVGPPTQYVESSSSSTRFYAASLQCAPHYRNWNTIGLLHVTGSAIVPSSNYSVEMLDSSCDGVETSPPCSTGGTNVSTWLQLKTTRWGDVTGPYAPPSETAQPDLGDVAAMVNKFRSAPGAPNKARVLLAGDDAFGNFTTLGVDMTFGHIAACVEAFRGRPYLHTIAACP